MLSVPDKSRTFTQEFLLASKPGPRLQYTAGAFYYRNVDKFPGTFASTNGAPLSFASAIGVKTISVAGFVDLTYEIVDNLFVTGGFEDRDGGMIRRISLGDVAISRFAGQNGQLGFVPGQLPSTLGCPAGMTIDPSGDLIFADLCDGVIAAIRPL